MIFHERVNLTPSIFFLQCGILLGMIVLLFCTWLTLTSCQLLMRAGIHSRRRSYEFLGKYFSGVSNITFTDSESDILFLFIVRAET